MLLSSLCEARQNALFHAAWIAMLEDSVWLALPCMLLPKEIKDNSTLPPGSHVYV